MARHKLVFNKRHKGFSSEEQNELGVQDICYTVNSTVALASLWIKRCFSQQRQTRLMVSLMLAIVISYY